MKHVINFFAFSFIAVILMGFKTVEGSSKEPCVNLPEEVTSLLETSSKEDYQDLEDHVCTLNSQIEFFMRNNSEFKVARPGYMLNDIIVRDIAKLKKDSSSEAEKLSREIRELILNEIFINNFGMGYQTHPTVIKWFEEIRDFDPFKQYK